MVAATVAGGVVAGIIGTVLQFVVFDLGEQELLTEAGVWGYVVARPPARADGAAPLSRGSRSAFVRVALVSIASGGGMIVNAVVATYLVFMVAATLLFGRLIRSLLPAPSLGWASVGE